MQIPLQIVFRDIEPSAAIEARIREEAAKLEDFHKGIIGCRVIIESPHRRRHKGKLYNVRVTLTVPGAELHVSRDPERDHAHEDVYVSIRDVFDAAKRRLQDQARRSRRAVKTHEEQPRGRVRRLFPADGYGFIETPDSREIYFHRNSVLEGGFDRLTEGTEVWFNEEQGDKGPQASSVHVVGKPGP